MEYPEEDTLNIYTDGSSLPKPRRGGLAVLFIVINEDGEEESYSPPLPGYASASNNQMELQACVEALKLATAQHPYFDRSRYRKILLRTDSEYVAGNYETALYVWSSNGWLKKSGAPVDNAPEWKELVRLLRRSERQGKRVNIKWVPGKSSPRTKAVEQLSPGTRGIVLLLLYLSIDRGDDRPLVIDQPEENLDPKSVFDELVYRFRETRGRRQVIIVTHNANLVVNTDADQVIVASAGPHRTDDLPEITYRGGGLEDPGIRREVCEILEGGQEAFTERAKRLRVRLPRQS
jgi:ribonuclease HI